MSDVILSMDYQNELLAFVHQYCDYVIEVDNVAFLIYNMYLTGSSSQLHRYNGESCVDTLASMQRMQRVESIDGRREEEEERAVQLDD